MHQLGEKIRKIRRIKNLSQLDVSEKIGLTQSEISKIENELNNRPQKKLNFKSPKEVFLFETLYGNTPFK